MISVRSCNLILRDASYYGNYDVFGRDSIRVNGWSFNR